MWTVDEKGYVCENGIVVDVTNADRTRAVFKFANTAHDLLTRGGFVGIHKGALLLALWPQGKPDGGQPLGDEEIKDWLQQLDDRLSQVEANHIPLCPVCGGRGVMYAGFYPLTADAGISGVTCRTCKGSGSLRC